MMYKFKAVIGEGFTSEFIFDTDFRNLYDAIIHELIYSTGTHREEYAYISSETTGQILAEFRAKPIIKNGFVSEIHIYCNELLCYVEYCDR